MSLGGPELARVGCKEPPFSQPAQRTEVLSLPRTPRCALSPATALDLAGCRFVLVLPCPSPPPSGPALRIPSAPLLPLHRRCGCRWLVARRLLDHLQPQLARLPPQRLDLLVLPLGLVLVLALTHVRHPVRQRQVDDPCQLVRRRGQRRLNPQPPFPPPQEPAQGPLAVVQTLGRQAQRLRRALDPPARPTGPDPATGLLPIG